METHVQHINFRAKGFSCVGKNVCGTKNLNPHQKNHIPRLTPTTYLSTYYFNNDRSEDREHAKWSKQGVLLLPNPILIYSLSSNYIVGGSVCTHQSCPPKQKKAVLSLTNIGHSKTYCSKSSVPKPIIHQFTPSTPNHLSFSFNDSSSLESYPCIDATFKCQMKGLYFKLS